MDGIHKGIEILDAVVFDDQAKIVFQERIPRGFVVQEDIHNYNKHHKQNHFRPTSHHE